MPEAKLRLPAEMVRALRVESVEAAARVTVTVYVVVVEPSSAVTTTGMAVSPPAVRLTAALALPLVTAAPLTVTVAAEWVTVGHSVALDVP